MTAIAIIALFSTIGIILYNLRGKMSPSWVKLPAPLAIGIGYWYYFAQSSGDSFLLLLAIGMSVAFAGDTLLAIDFKKNLIYGLAAFAVGYILFIAALISGYADNLSITTTIVAALFLIIAFFIYRKFTIADSIQKIAVPVYYLILVTLVASATEICPATVVGAALLFGCDSVIGLNAFSKPIKGSDGISLTFYNLGHLTFFISVIIFRVYGTSLCSLSTGM